MILSGLIKYWWILHYCKCKLKYIELGVMKIELIQVIIEKKLLILY